MTSAPTTRKHEQTTHSLPEEHFLTLATHLACGFSWVYARIQVEDNTRHERPGHEAFLRSAKISIPHETRHDRATIDRNSPALLVNLRGIADVSG